MDKKKFIIVLTTILAIISLIALISGFLFWLQWNKSNKPLNESQKNTENSNNLQESASKNVVPAFQTNPLENKPDVNPANKANPFIKIKTNPF